MYKNALVQLGEHKKHVIKSKKANTATATSTTTQWNKKCGSKLGHLRFVIRSCLWVALGAPQHLVRGRVSTTNVLCRRVSSRIAAGPPPMSRGIVILGCLFSDFDWTFQYRGASSKMITTQGVLKTASSTTLLPCRHDLYSLRCWRLYRYASAHTKGFFCHRAARWQFWPLGSNRNHSVRRICVIARNGATTACGLT